MSYRRTAYVFLSLLLVLIVVTPSIGLAQEDNVDIYGRALPEDAAPYAYQIYQELCDGNAGFSTFMAAVAVYKRFCAGADIFSDNLVMLDINMQLIPAAAESWEPAEDGLSWYFHLRPGQVWSDGTPFTAYDFEATWRYMADPATAYDFVWMWLGIIEGWDEAVAGEIPPEEVGVVAVDDLTLQVRTQGTIPYLPNTFFFWPPLSKAALEAYGPDYVVDPEHSVSAGPFILKEFVAGDRFVLEANPTYKGFRPPRLRQIRGFLGDPNTMFLAYQNHQTDNVDYSFLKPADYEIIVNDPVMNANYRPHSGDFRTDYLFFDTYNPPFDDVRVRMAFAKAVDRQSIVDNIINAAGIENAIPAWSMLAPGFPAWDAEGNLADVQVYDCDAAKALLADAGYPDGEGFPPQSLKLRNEAEGIASWYIAAAASITECLGIPIEVDNMDYTAFMEGLLQRPTTITLGGVSYGMDYLDPSNMLGLWHSRGRQSWRNAEYDRLIDETAVLVGDPEGRIAMYKEAERILVEEAGGVFLFWRRLGNILQPYIAGPECLKPDAQGVSAWHWGNDWCRSDFYVTKDVLNYETYRDEIVAAGE